MREIKFRAWDGENMNSEFIIVDTAWMMNKEVGCPVNAGFKNMQEQAENWIIMQYTGLKDKNGKEIYEGDIVLDQWTHYDTKFRRHEVRFGQHETSGDYYASTAYGWFISGEESLTPGLAIQIEVIGNIYENPELSEAKEI